jgi:hypothetical protein
MGAGTALVASARLRKVVERSAHATTVPAATRPRFYMQIIPSGGMDAVYTVDPKTSREVLDGIDVAFPAADLIDSGPIRLAPTMRPLAKWASRFAVVNAFRQNSANHQSGIAHVTRCKSDTTTAMPTLCDILGARRHDEALGAMSINADFSTAYSDRYLGDPSNFFYGSDPGLFQHLDTAEPDDLRAVARALDREAASFGGHRLSAQERNTADNLRACSTLFGRAAGAPRFQPETWDHKVEKRFFAGQHLQRAVWLFENRLARCVTVCVGRLNFDTHETNSDQLDMTGYLATQLDRLFALLDARQVDGRPLSEQTVVFIGSEIGRFPRLNGALGKDHFPQAPYLFYGAPFKGGVVHGATDREMIAQPVDLATGRPHKGGHLLQIDDLGTTLLRLDGADPLLYGYTGQPLRFLDA